MTENPSRAMCLQESDGAFHSGAANWRYSQSLLLSSFCPPLEEAHQHPQKNRDAGKATVPDVDWLR